MKRYVLFEDSGFANLLPVLYWRTVFEVRCGCESLSERIERLAQTPPAGLWTRSWIADVAADRFPLPINQPLEVGDVLVNGRWSPDGPVTFPNEATVAVCDGAIAYLVCDAALAEKLGPESVLDPDERHELLMAAPKREVPGAMIGYPWDILTRSTKLLQEDCRLRGAGVKGEVHPSAVLLKPESIRIESGARVAPGAVLDASTGPILIAGNAVIDAHAVIKGPACIDRDSVVNPHAYIHGGTSIGPVCKVGGEIDACVFQGYANKQHEGFLGHAFVGCWVNLGAGTVNSDLKNTYGTVRMPINGALVDTGEMFVGAVLGDHVKTGINTTLPTGSVIGFGATVACSRSLPPFVGSFSWLTDRGLDEGDADRLVETARHALSRRNISLSKAETALFAKLQQVAAYFEPPIAAQRQSVEPQKQAQQQSVPELD